MFLIYFVTFLIENHFMFLSTLWMFIVGYFINSLLLSKIVGVPFRSAQSSSFKISLISAAFSVVFTWYLLSWVLAFLGAMTGFIGSKLLLFTGVAVVFYCCSVYFLSNMVEDDDNQDLQLWLLLAHLICGIIGFWIVEFLGSFLLRLLMGMI